MHSLLDKLKELSQHMPVNIRLSIAERTSRNYIRDRLNEQDRTVAEEIFRLLVKDTEAQIRTALSEALKYDLTIPHDVALSLANDMEDSVALPMLQSSEILTEDDLVHIVETVDSLSRHMAIAQRKSIPQRLTQYLIVAGKRSVTEVLLNNPGSTIDDEAAIQIAEHYPQDEPLILQLLQRHHLSLPLAEKLVTRVSDTIKRAIMKQSRLSPYQLEDAVQSTEEWARLKLLDKADLKTLTNFVQHLHTEDRLDASLMIRGLSAGHLLFFELALSIRARTPIKNCRKLLHDKGSLGFKALYRAADMPAGFFEAIKVLYHIVWQETDKGTRTPPDITKRVTEAIMRDRYQDTIDNMPFILALLARNMPMGNSAPLKILQY